MADHTEQSIVMNADVADIMAVIADFDRYPEWVTAAREVHVKERDAQGRGVQVEFVLDAGVLADTYELRYTWNDDGAGVSWGLLSSGLQRAQQGSYRLVQQVPGSTKVTYSLMVDLQIPMISQLKRRAEKAITEAALGELKKRVEG
ncbi:SRPBCC family protein [Gordonia sp. (in: high G+C Gram-positive bacteria)]|uniref:SRPBCC family protein n=1 Tax=Gordonia sp. (in: high G+C Gram-positive bacteria) TaxID=84139 RepID=UPI0016940775|nr:SRPBCC family protein [Gordonia sp. (in: high G+C Gram-positive bacteria)]NLG47025.1 SRPBCC family protein [Gordonia sp. (in: high G+C Gram-positive bacteria)]